MNDLRGAIDMVEQLGIAGGIILGAGGLYWLYRSMRQIDTQATPKGKPSAVCPLVPVLDAETVRDIVREEVLAAAKEAVMTTVGAVHKTADEARDSHQARDMTVQAGLSSTQTLARQQADCLDRLSASLHELQKVANDLRVIASSQQEFNRHIGDELKAIRRTGEESAGRLQLIAGRQER